MEPATKIKINTCKVKGFCYYITLTHLTSLASYHNLSNWFCYFQLVFTGFSTVVSLSSSCLELLNNKFVAKYKTVSKLRLSVA